MKIELDPVTVDKIVAKELKAIRKMYKKDFKELKSRSAYLTDAMLDNMEYTERMILSLGEVISLFEGKAL